MVLWCEWPSPATAEECFGWPLLSPSPRKLGMKSSTLWGDLNMHNAGALCRPFLPLASGAQPLHGARHPLFPPQLIFRSLHGMAAGRPYSSSSTSQSHFEYFERFISSPVLQMLLPPCKASPGAVQWVLHASCCSAWPRHHTNWSQHGLVGCAGTYRKGQPNYQRTGQLRRWTSARHSFSLTHICSFSTI